MPSHRTDPLTDLNFIKLKQLATNGGQSGPDFDKGILSVIDQIERDGSFVPTRLRPLIDLADRPEVMPNYYKNDEIAELKQELVRRGWTPEQGASFAKGASAAEDALQEYRLGAKD